MAEPQPRSVHEGATGDVDEEVQTTAKSAEDRKAAAAMASLDSRGDDASTSGNAVDQDAVNRAVQGLGGGAVEKKEVKKVKVDPADVTLLVSFYLSPTRSNIGTYADEREYDDRLTS